MSTEHINRDMKILVVDDFATMRRIVRNILEQLGFHHIYEAEDGKDAFDRLNKKPVDLIISDWNMPKMMGRRATKRTCFSLYRPEFRTTS